MLTRKKNICEKRKYYHRKHIREKKKISLLIEKSFDEAAIDFNKVTCDLFKFRSVTAFLFLNGAEIYKFTTPLCLGSISKDWLVDNMKKTGFTGYIYDLSVDYDATAVDDIKDIHKYLMKKNNIV